MKILMSMVTTRMLFSRNARAIAHWNSQSCGSVHKVQERLKSDKTAAWKEGGEQEITKQSLVHNYRATQEVLDYFY